MNLFLFKKIKIKKSLVYQFKRLKKKDFILLEFFNLFELFFFKTVLLNLNIFFFYMASRFINLASCFKLLKINFFFIISCFKLQPFFTFLTYKFFTRYCISNGSACKLLFLKKKSMRRSSAKHAPIIFFFKETFKEFFLNPVFFVLNGYKKKYSNLAFNICKKLLWLNRSSTLIILPRKSLGFYKFRKVKAIKRRIRKKLLNKIK